MFTFDKLQVKISLHAIYSEIKLKPSTHTRLSKLSGDELSQCLDNF